jgi:hypothetical protein
LGCGGEKVLFRRGACRQRSDDVLIGLAVRGNGATKGENSVVLFPPDVAF